MYFLSVVEEVHRYFTWGKVEIPQWKIYSITIQVLHSKFDMSKSTEIMYLCDEAKLPDVLNQFFACFNTQRGRSAPLINLPAGDLTLVSQHHQMRTRKWMQAVRQAWMECLALKACANKFTEVFIKIFNISLQQAAVPKKIICEVSEWLSPSGVNSHRQVQQPNASRNLCFRTSEPSSA